MDRSHKKKKKLSSVSCNIKIEKKMHVKYKRNKTTLYYISSALRSNSIKHQESKMSTWSTSTQKQEKRPKKSIKNQNREHSTSK